MATRIKRDKEEEKLKTKKLFLMLIITALVCATLAVAVFVYFFVPISSDTYSLIIPSYSTLVDTEREFDGISIKREWIYSSDVPEGHIISQEPYAGAKRKVKKGAFYEVTVYISLGERTEIIPKLSGVPEMSAAAALRSIGAHVRSVSLYDGGEDGEVLYTSPSDGERIREGDTVTIFVSRKRTQTSVIVPDFCGYTLSEACRYALRLGLCISEETDYADMNAVVSGQSIHKNAKVRSGSYISFKTEARDKDEREWPPTVAE